MRNLVPLLSLLVLLHPLTAQETPAKRIWATSFLGKKAPDFVVEKWLTAEPQRQGKFLLLDFWATWCAPCRQAIPELNALQKKFATNLVIIGVSDEPEEKVRALKEPKLEYASALDTQGRMKKALGVKGIPHVILIDPDGYVRWEGFPLLEGYELNEAAVREVLDRDATMRKVCTLNRDLIQGAKKQWALEKNQPATVTPVERDIRVYLLRDELPTCPAGGAYTLNAVGQPATCSVHSPGKP